MIGNIHSIETFGTVDGPGIRFVLFLKGCLLRCSYCHNPDTWELLGAKQVTSSEVISNVLKYKNYYKNGGLTISGGEPLLQLDFIIDVCKRAKEAGIHTAIDTSGATFNNCDINKYDELIKYVDLFLLDIKHIDEDKCIKLTGKSNKNTISFAEYLNKNNKPVWIRYVLVPGITDKEQDIVQLKEFIQTLNCVEKVEVLGYHWLGKEKWELRGEKHPLEGVPEATFEDVKKAEKILGIIN